MRVGPRPRLVMVTAAVAAGTAASLWLTLGTGAAVGRDAQAPTAQASSPPTTVQPSTGTEAAGPAAPVDPATSMLSTAEATVAVVHRRTQLFTAPGGRLLRTISAVTPLGSQRTLLVLAGRPDGWLQVQLPVRPNGSRAWLRAADVATATTPLRLVVDTRAHAMTLLRSGVPVRRFPVAVGATATPTPDGLFFVTDIIDTLDPGGPFGPYALGLSGYSNVLTSFDGGDGVVGIHGTNADWSVGHAVSHGCIRMHNSDVLWLSKQVSLGVPVLVESRPAARPERVIAARSQSRAT